MKKRKTLADVASAAGVSKMTASRALRGAADVSKANIEKVRAAAREIGYVGNHLATSLSTQRTSLVGVVVPSLANIVFAEVLSGVAEGLAGSALQPVFGVSDYDPEAEFTAVRSLLSWRPAGLIVTGLDQNEATRRLLTDAEIPVVQIMDTDGTPIDSCIGLSHLGAGRDMAAALWQAGRRRIGYVGCAPERDTRAAKRLEGFEAGIAAQGGALAGRALSGELSSVAQGRRLTADLLARCPDLDCIYFSNDDVAAGGLFHCFSEGIDVPGRLMLAGFNGLDLLEGLPVRIATARTPRREIGRRAAQLIRARSEDPEAKPDRRVDLGARIELGG